jgi:hypothetical protein
MKQKYVLYGPPDQWQRPGGVCCLRVLSGYDYYTTSCHTSDDNHMNHRERSFQAARVRSQVRSHGSAVDKVVHSRISPSTSAPPVDSQSTDCSQIHETSYHRRYRVSILTASLNSQLGEEKIIFAARETLKYLEQFHLFKCHRLL